MAEYLSTAELGKYLKLNQKKVYAMVAAGELPAVRISGKWLFPKELVDQWLRERTIQPASGLMVALLDQLLVVQGSDDWLLTRILEHVQRHFPVSAAAVGSGAGLEAVARGRAHVAPYHLSATEARRLLGAPAYLVDLFERQQGLIVDAARTPGIADLRAVSERRLRFAARQPGSGTAQLVVRLAHAAGVAPEWIDVGPYNSHLEVALAVRNGETDVGVGIEIAAHKTGLGFVPLFGETFALAVPALYFSHPRVAQFLELTFDAARAHATRGVPGYTLAALGRLQPTS